MKATVREIMEAGLWERVCEIEGINPWAVNEGLMGDDHEIELSDACIRSMLDLQRSPCSLPETKAGTQQKEDSGERGR